MRVRGFEVVSRLEGTFDESLMPKRSTGKSAGYDFFAYEDVEIPPSFPIYKHENYFYLIGNFKSITDFKLQPFVVKTGIKAYMKDDEVLYLFNRSSNPKKLGLVIPNSVGVVDSDDYNNPDNEGEMGFLFYNLFPCKIVIKKGQKIGQGVFSKFYKADGDDVNSVRLGGFGSTGS